jgi:hypothetical protein
LWKSHPADDFPRQTSCIERAAGLRIGIILENFSNVRHLQEVRSKIAMLTFFVSFNSPVIVHRLRCRFDRSRRSYPHFPHAALLAARDCLL